MKTDEHLVFRWSPTGYALDVRPGGAPSPGVTVDAGERRYRVTKVAVSPLPGDRRACAYLLPAEEDAAETPTTNSGNHVAPPELVPTWTAPRDDLSLLLDAYPEGACVVAVDAEGRRLGLTVGSLVSLSLEPPLIGFSVSNEGAMLELLPDAGGCAISILAGGQEWLADHFAEGARPIAMWHGLAAEPGAAGAPLYVGALGWLECSLLDTVDLGTRTLFVCDVRRIEPGHVAPALVHVRGSYGDV